MRVLISQNLKMDHELINLLIKNLTPETKTEAIKVLSKFNLSINRSALETLIKLVQEKLENILNYSVSRYSNILFSKKDFGVTLQQKFFQNKILLRMGK